MKRTLQVVFELDGRPVTFETPPERRLLDLLREDAGITGVREGCGEGECGSCSVLVNGKLVNACCASVLSVQGCSVVTIQGFAQTALYRHIAEAFARVGAVQCGFCTPGFILATAALLRTTPHPSEADIRTGLSGNLCRCTGYTQIAQAVQEVADTLRREPCSRQMIETSVSFTTRHPLVPHTVAEAAALLQTGYRPVAGGTDLIIRQHALKGLRLFQDADDVPGLFSCTQITELHSMYSKSGRLYVGSSMSLSEIMASPDCIPLLKEALSSFASPAIRNVATLTGNVCNASPAADTLPVLYILNATIHVVGPSGRRDIPIAECINGPGKTVFEPTELVTWISCEIPDAGRQAGNWIFRKVGTRAVNALAKVNLAALWKVDDGIVSDFRLAVGACGPTVVRSPQVEQLIIGTSVDTLPERVDQWVAMYGELLHPITDQRSTAEYRQHTALALIRNVFKSI